jgi:hypothetical protein
MTMAFAVAAAKSSLSPPGAASLAIDVRIN